MPADCSLLRDALRKALLAGVILGTVLDLASAAGFERHDLGGAWQVFQNGQGEAIPATVPGQVHLDLLAAKKIPDPYYRDNEARVQWVGEASWTYRRSFDVPAALLQREHVLLRCEGLDTLATVRINDADVAHTDNMFRTYEFDVKKLLKTGTNSIEVKFDSVVPFVRAKEAARKLPTWAYPGAAYVRKEPCNFGWDWGPTLITCGIWRDIALVSFDTARIDDVAILQDHSRKGQVALVVDVAAGPGANAGLKAKTTVSLDGRSIGEVVANLEEGRCKAEIVVSEPKLWWPAGMGQQPLYSVRVELLDNSGQVIDTTTKRIGLRTLRAIEKTKDAPMHFVVNGVPFFSKGANWIPADCFSARLTREALKKYAQDAVAVNMNTLRFWGGGYYEDDALFDACDELGLCIWLDFKFGCTTYPAFDPAFLENVTAEARDNIRRLRHHPSIAVWCGNNEIEAFRGKDEWTKDKMSAGDYYKLFRDTLGEQVDELAPQSDYVTGSPDCGDVHFWDVWHGGKPFEVYLDIHGFVSEFGFQSFAVPKTVRSFTAPEDRDSVYSHVMKYHERSNRMYMDVPEDGTIGTNKIMNLVKMYFREPKDFDSALWLSQITHGYGIKYGAEGWRREMPKSMGCVYWQYNDTWPGTSWASVDYFGRWKALHYMAKRFYAPVLISGAEDTKAGTVDIYVTSDCMKDRHGKASWIVTDVAGTKLEAGSVDVDVPVRSSQKVRSLDLKDLIAKQGANNVLVWLKLEINGAVVSDNLVTFVYPKELDLRDPNLQSEVTDRGDGRFTVKLTSECPALWAWLDLEGADIHCSDNFIPVAKDHPVVIEVTTDKALTKEAFQKALRVRSLYDTYKH